MQAIHVNSTAPYFSKNGAVPYRPETVDLYTTALSALQWRKLGGRITMFTDLKGYAFYKEHGLLSLWDDVRFYLPQDLEGIDPQCFWAAGKLLALREIKAPCTIIDTDFILWKMPCLDKALVVAHFEDLNPYVYPPKEYFKYSKNHTFPSDLDWTVPAVNTAFLYLPDEDFKQYYVSQAISFMKHAKPNGDPLRYMVFAEQRFLAMCAKKLGYKITPLLKKNKLFYPQSDFTHIWGAKQAMRDDKDMKSDFIERCKERLLKDFPLYSPIVRKIESIPLF